MKKIAVEIKDFNLSVSGKMLFENFRYEIEKGSITAIVGPNGAGKTMLMKAMLGLKDYDGSVKILGKSIKEVLDLVGYVPQKFEFDRTIPLSIEEFLALVAREKDVKEKEKKINFVLKEVDMAKQRKKKLGALSGGQLQRVLIASAILNDPPILFLDEPTTGIDQEGQLSFYDIINHLNEVHGTTIVMISHHGEAVKKYADQIIQC